MDYIVEDDGKGNVTVRCEHGEAYTRTSAMGMFCDKPDCTCETIARRTMGELGDFMASLGLSRTPPSAENDAVFKSWRAEVGTDRETTRRIVESDVTPVNYEHGAKQHG